MGIDVDAENFTGDAAIEALDHAVGLGRPRLRMAILRAECRADFGEGWGEAAAVVAQHMGELEGNAAAASRNKAMALFSVSSSLTARWTEREQRSMATNR